MNKKGFTLTELLAVIIIIGVISTIAVSGVRAVLASINESMVNSKEKMARETAILYGQDNRVLLTDKCMIDEVEYTTCKKVTVQFLIDADYFETEETCDNADGTEYPCLYDNVNKQSKNNDVITIYIKNNRVNAKYGDFIILDE